MNQYDFTPIPPDYPRLARLALVGIVIAAIILTLAMSCSDKDKPPTMEEQLHGAWVREWVGLKNTYNFHDGACDTYSIVPGQPVQYYAYSYTTDGDILRMVDLASEDQYLYSVSFPTDSTAILSRSGWVEYQLKRI